MQMWRRRNIGVRLVAVVIAVGVVVSGVWSVWAEETQPTGNMVFFKGGFVGFNSNRGGEFFTDCGLASNTCGQNNSSTGWYVGAGLDLVLSKDAWGMMSKTWAVGEIGLQFNRIGSQTVLVGVSAATGPSVQAWIRRTLSPNGQHDQYEQQLWPGGPLRRDQFLTRRLVPCAYSLCEVRCIS
jgi:hypothetical protein